MKTYSKPEILVLGDASRVITANGCAKSTTANDGGTPSCGHTGGPPAYDLDE